MGISRSFWATLAVAGGLIACETSFAATINVDSTADTPAVGGMCPAGSCTLRAAIQTANANADASNTINFSNSVTSTTLLTDLPVITKQVTISDTSGTFTVDGNGKSIIRVDSTAAGGTYFFSNLVLQNGTTASSFGGGAVYLAPSGISTITLSGVTIAGASATNGPGGAIAVQLTSSGSILHLTGVNITNSTATGNGGGIWVDVLGTGTMTLDDSVLSGNHSDASGGALCVNSGRLSIGGTTFSANTANASGGAIFLNNGSAGGTVSDGSIRLENSTLSGNTATGSGGGIGTAATNAAASWLTFNTIMGNTGASGGGIKGASNPNITFPGNTASNPFSSNIIAGNTGGNCGAAFSPAHSDTSNSGYNLTDDATCGFVDGTNHDHVVANAALKIGGLAQNTSSTSDPKTRALQFGSPAIDAGNPNALFDTGADQRGADRQDGGADGTPGDSTALPDIGAYEYGGLGLVGLTAANFNIAEDFTPVVVTLKRYGTGTAASTAPSATLGTNSTGATATAAACNSGGDYVAISPNPTTLAFTATAGVNQFDQSANITICKDSTGNEGSETFNLVLNKLGSDTTGYDLGLAAGTVTIQDVENGQFSFSSGTASAPEGNVGADGSVQLTINRTVGTHGAVRVTYSTRTTTACTPSDCTATADTDYTSVAGGTVDFADGESSKVINLTLKGDAAFEADETFQVTFTVSCLNLASGQSCDATVGAGTSTITITNDDTAQPGTIAFVVPAGGYVANENGTSMTVTVSRSGGTDGSVTVAYSAVDSAYTTQGPTGDYFLDQVNPHTLTWANGVGGNKTFTVSLVDNTTRESDRTFTLKLDPPTGGAGSQLPQPQQAQTTDVKLVSDEKPSFQFSATTATVNENAQTNLSVTSQTFTGPPVSVPYTASGAAVGNGTDYTLTAQNGDTVGTLNFDGSGTSHTITVAATNDGVVEGNESFTLTLGTPVGGGALGANTAGTVTIVDPTAIRFTSAVFNSTAETGASTITMTVERIGSSVGDIDTTFTISQDCASQPTAGCAQPTVDYTRAGGFSGGLHWNDGETANKPFSVTVLSDTLIEGDETIAVSLSTPTGMAGAVLGAQSTAKANIRDDDYRLQIADTTVDEGVGSAQIQVQRIGTGSAIGTASVNFATSDDTATTAGSDYTAATGTLNWTAGSTAPQAVAVPINNDSAIEGDEKFKITLSNASANASGEAISVTGSPASITIQDNDATVAFSAVSQTVGENAVMVTVTATRTGAAGFAIDVPFTVSKGGSVANTAADGNIAIAVNQTSGTYTFMITDDSKDGADGSVIFTMGTPTGGTGTVTAVAPTTHTVTITDNDSVTVAFSTASQSVGENAGTATVTVTRTGATDFAVSVPFTLGAGTASNPADHNAVGGTINIPANQPSGTYTFNVVSDTLDEPNETVIFNMGTPTGGDVSAVALTTQTVTITDDDNPPTVTLSQTGNPMAENGGVATVRATLSAASANTVTVNLAFSGTATLTSDYTKSSSSISIAPGATFGTITLTSVDDTGFEGDETIITDIASVTNGTEAGTQQVTTTITEDDAPPAGGGGGGSWSLMSLWLLVPAWMRRRRATQ